MTCALRILLASTVALVTTFAALSAHAAFTDNGDGTITDTVTGLQWDKCAYGQFAGDCSGGAAARRAWSQALTDVVALNSGVYKGHNDWRLPNVKELESLVKIDSLNPAIDGTAFPNTDFSFAYWSSTLFVPPMPTFSGQAWGVDFNLGFVDIIDTSSSANKSFVRLVRNGQPVDSFDLLAPASAAPTPIARAALAISAPDVVATTAGARNTSSQTQSSGQRTFSASTGTGSGIATANMTTVDGGAACGFVGSGFMAVSAVPSAPPAGVRFPHGLASLRIANCAATGTTVTVTLTFPQPLPPETVYWKYGPATKGGAAVWYVMPGAIVAGNTITLPLTDGQLGDDDWTANGLISDPGGPGLATAASLVPSEAIPVLDGWPLRMLLALFVLLVAITRGRPAMLRGHGPR
ncbi:MAG: DUF1566 domain-containing protein [Casimicrobiaceae bacterium]